MYHTIWTYLWDLCEDGIDVERLKRWVIENLDDVFATGQSLDGDIESFVAEERELAAFQLMREKLVTSLIEQIKTESKSRKVSFLLTGDRCTAGIRPENIAKNCDFLGTLIYTDSPDVIADRIESTVTR